MSLQQTGNQERQIEDRDKAAPARRKHPEKRDRCSVEDREGEDRFRRGIAGGVQQFKDRRAGDQADGGV